MFIVFFPHHISLKMRSGWPLNHSASLSVLCSLVCDIVQFMWCAGKQKVCS